MSKRKAVKHAEDLGGLDDHDRMLVADMDWNQAIHEEVEDGEDDLPEADVHVTAPQVEGKNDSLGLGEA